MKSVRRMLEIAAIAAAALVLGAAVWYLALDWGGTEGSREGTLVRLEAEEARPAFHTRPQVRTEQGAPAVRSAGGL